MFNVRTNTWTLMKTEMLWPVAYASSVVHDDKFYILGGNDKGNLLSSTQVL